MPLRVSTKWSKLRPSPFQWTYIAEVHQNIRWDIELRHVKSIKNGYRKQSDKLHLAEDVAWPHMDILFVPFRNHQPYLSPLLLILCPHSRSTFTSSIQSTCKSLVTAFAIKHSIFSCEAPVSVNAPRSTSLYCICLCLRFEQLKHIRFNLNQFEEPCIDGAAICNAEHRRFLRERKKWRNLKIL